MFATIFRRFSRHKLGANLHRLTRGTRPPPQHILLNNFPLDLYISVIYTYVICIYERNCLQLLHGTLNMHIWRVMIFSSSVSPFRMLLIEQFSIMDINVSNVSRCGQRAVMACDALLSSSSRIWYGPCFFSQTYATVKIMVLSHFLEWPIKFSN